MKKILWTVVLLLAMSLGVKASPIDSLVVNRDTQILTVSGDFGSNGAYKRIVCKILRPDVTLDSLTDSEAGDIFEKICGLYDTVADSDGKYSLSFKMSVPSGIYTAAVGGVDKDESFLKTFEFFSSQDILKCLENLENARKNNDKNSIKAILDEEICRKQLGINDISYGNVNYKSASDELCYLLSVQTDGFETITDFQNLYEQLCVIQLFRSNTDPGAVNEQLILCDGILNVLSSDEYKMYQDFESELKSRVNLALTNSDFISADEIVTAFKQNTLLTYNFAMDSWTMFNAFITKYHDVLGVDLSAYSKLDASQKNYVDKSMTARDFASADKFLSSFVSFVKSAADKGESTIGGGGGGGGGSKTGSTSLFANIPVTVPPLTNTAKFNDIKDVPWALNAIEMLTEKGVLSGRASGVFAPMENITREETVKMIVLAFGISMDNTESELFEDVRADDWSAKYISAAIKSKIATGNETGLFMPKENISRQDFAVLLYRTMLIKGNIPDIQSGYEAFYDESSIAPYATEAVKVLKTAGVINGVGNGLFMPQASCTRAEAAKMIYEFMLKTE